MVSPAPYIITYVENDVRISVEEFAVLLFGPVGHFEILHSAIIVVVFITFISGN